MKVMRKNKIRKNLNAVFQRECKQVVYLDYE